MVCSRGESLTTHTYQMKLFNAIAAAVVIGTSLIAANPGEAANRNRLCTFNNRHIPGQNIRKMSQVLNQTCHFDYAVLRFEQVARQSLETQPNPTGGS